MWGSFKKLNCILDRKDFLSLAVLILFVAVAAMLEIVGIFSILPFMQVVSDPQSIDTNRWLSWIHSTFQFASHKTMVTWMGFTVLGVYALTAVANVLTYWLITRTVWGIAHRIAMRLLNRYTRLPYEFFLTNNSAELIKKAISDIHTLVSGVLMASCQFVADGLKSLVILLLLFFVNYKLALLAFVAYGGAYIAMHLMRHKYLKSLGIDRLATISLRIKSFTEILAGIKTLRVSGSTDLFVNRFERASQRFSNIQPRFMLFNLIPQKSIELLAFGGMVGVVLYLLLNDIDLINVIPTLSVFALATYKLLPALSNAFSQAAKLSHNLPVIDVVHEDMREDWQLLKPAKEFAAADPIRFQKNIKIQEISYRYDSAGLPVLENVNLEIPKSSRCALVGSTGCGKSTLVDIMVGLLFPASGQLLVDSQAINVENVFGWQKIIAYVPQEVFLYDDTVAANIALGVPYDEIDEDLLKRSAKLARVDDFVNAELVSSELIDLRLRLDKQTCRRCEENKCEHRADEGERSAEPPGIAPEIGYVRLLLWESAPTGGDAGPDDERKCGANEQWCRYRFPTFVSRCQHIQDICRGKKITQTPIPERAASVAPTLSLRLVHRPRVSQRNQVHSRQRV